MLVLQRGRLWSAVREGGILDLVWGCTQTNLGPYLMIPWLLILLPLYLLSMASVDYADMSPECEVASWDWLPGGVLGPASQ